MAPLLSPNAIFFEFVSRLPPSCGVVSATTSPPPIVIVLVAPDPVAVTLLPTKFNVVAAVDNVLPSSCTLIPAPISS